MQHTFSTTETVLTLSAKFTRWKMLSMLSVRAFLVDWRTAPCTYLLDFVFAAMMPTSVERSVAASFESMSSSSAALRAIFSESSSSLM